MDMVFLRPMLKAFPTSIFFKDGGKLWICGEKLN